MQLRDNSACLPRQVAGLLMNGCKMFWDPLMRHLWKSKIWWCQWKLAVWLQILTAYKKRDTHQSLARETGNMRHWEKQRTAPDVSEQMLELFFAKIRHDDFVSKMRRLHQGCTGRAPRLAPEIRFTMMLFPVCWTMDYKMKQCTCWTGDIHPPFCQGISSPC